MRSYLLLNLATVGVLPDAHDELIVEDSVLVVSGFVRKIELRGENRIIGRLNLHMDVTSPSGIESRNDRMQHEIAFLIRVLVAGLEEHTNNPSGSPLGSQHFTRVTNPAEAL
ncbi:hypothetical protein [Paenibacillus terrigena]|uniref:hypothetical protein n=1 Tax=Paenibacillus terrigena TaxID=369333 RepID=UPI0028D460BD|nr:hypothetical protein [Paenibacillus terrigena]